MNKIPLKHQACYPRLKADRTYHRQEDAHAVLARHIERVLRHIEKLSVFDRVMCSTGYDDALDYVIKNLSCSPEWLHVESFEPGVEYWGWKVPSSLNFWRDADRPSSIEIPNYRPMRLLDVQVPGKRGSREILIVAHLDHPRPSANDNASGAAMMVELVNYYSETHPETSLRFLFTVEYFGTVAYCRRHEKELRSITAGISLDMVGADQNICRSALIVDEIPHHHVSPLDLLLRQRLEEITREGHYREIGNSLPAYRCDFQYYTGGSDHYILNDASIGIPATCLNTYPDPSYHTRNDTAEKISPETLRIFFNTITSSLSDFGDQGTEALTWKSQLIINRFNEMVNDTLLELPTTDDKTIFEYSFRLRHAFSLSALRLENLWELSRSEESGRWSSSLTRAYEDACERFFLISGCKPPQSGWKNGRRFSRRFKAPLCRNRLFEIITQEEKEQVGEELQRDQLFFHKLDAALNYCRTKGTAEISWLLRMHYGGEDYERKLDKYFDLLCRYGLMEEEAGGGRK